MRSNNEHSTTDRVNIVQTVTLGLAGVPVTLGLFWAMNAFAELAATSGLSWLLVAALIVAPVVICIGGERP